MSPWEALGWLIVGGCAGVCLAYGYTGRRRPAPAVPGWDAALDEHMLRLP